MFFSCRERRWVVFIYPEPPSNRETILEALVTIYKGLIRKGIVESELPRKNGAYLVTRREANQPNRLKNKLTQYADEDSWLKSPRIARR